MTTDGSLLRTGSRPVLRFERHLRRPIEVVWKAVTDPVQLQSWFSTRIVIDEWKIGAPLSHVFEEHEIDPLPGTVLEWDPPGRVSFTWGTDTISFELTATDERTTLFVLTVELSASIAARNAAGWEVCLDRLERGTAEEPWRPRFERYVAAFEAMLGPQDGPPPGYRNQTDGG